MTGGVRTGRGFTGARAAVEGRTSDGALLRFPRRRVELVP